MKTELICIGSIEAIAKVWHGLFESGRLVMMHRQAEGTRWIATFVVLSEYVEVIS
jgi:hypothetical protein